MHGLEQLDREIGDGPAHRPIEARLTAGRAAVRRRRLVAGSAALVAALVAGTAVLLGGGSEPTATNKPPIATLATPTSTPTPTPVEPRRRTSLSTELVVLEPDGTLDLARGVKLVRSIPNPLGVALPSRSVGLEITFRGETYWQVLESTPDGGFTASDPAGKAFATLEDWVTDQVALQQGTPPEALVELTAKGRLRPLGDARIAEARYDVGGFEAVAEVLHDNRRTYVLVNDGDVVRVDGSVGGKDLDAFVDYARAHYASGEGLR